MVLEKVADVGPARAGGRATGAGSDLGRAPETIDAYARGLAEYLVMCGREGVDPRGAHRAHAAVLVRERVATVLLFLAPMPEPDQLSRSPTVTGLTLPGSGAELRERNSSGLRNLMNADTGCVYQLSNDLRCAFRINVQAELRGPSRGAPRRPYVA